MKPAERKNRGKTPKPLSTKTPPVPTSSHAELDELFRRQVIPDMQPMAKRVDALIREAIPGLHYAIKWGKVFYGLPTRGWIIEMCPYQVSLNVLFFAGADFDSPPPLGTVGRSRYVKLRSLEEVEEPLLHQWIRQAARMDGWK